MRRRVAFIIMIIFVASTVVTFAEEAKKSVFQDVYNDIAGFKLIKTKDKKPASAVFQASKDYIEESTPKAKELSLREDKEELKKRRSGE